MKNPYQNHSLKPVGAQPSQADTSHLTELFHQNKNDELELAARALLVKYPKHGFIWKYWAQCYSV